MQQLQVGSHIVYSDRVLRLLGKCTCRYIVVYQEADIVVCERPRPFGEDMRVQAPPPDKPVTFAVCTCFFYLYRPLLNWSSWYSGAGLRATKFFWYLPKIAFISGVSLAETLLSRSWVLA